MGAQRALYRALDRFVDDMTEPLEAYRPGSNSSETPHGVVAKMKSTNGRSLLLLELTRAAHAFVARARPLLTISVHTPRCTTWQGHFALRQGQCGSTLHMPRGRLHRAEHSCKQFPIENAFFRSHRGVGRAGPNPGDEHCAGPNPGSGSAGGAQPRGTGVRIRQVATPLHARVHRCRWMHVKG
jgi:hypothetical protein